MRVPFDPPGARTEDGWTLDEGNPDRVPLKGFRRWSRPVPGGREYRTRYHYLEHIADFALPADGRRIEVSWTEHVSEADVAVLLSGPILGRALRLAGVHCLHATTVTAGGRAISVMGASGMGKSSLAAALVGLGCTLLSDDQTACVRRDGRVHALPGQTGLHLWRDAAERLATPDATRPIWPGVSELHKYVVDTGGVEAGGGSDGAAGGVSSGAVANQTGGAGGHDGAEAIAAVYLLGPRLPAGSAPLTTEIPPAQRLAILCANVYGSEIQPSVAVRARELAFFAEMARLVPVRHLRLPEGLPGLEAAAAAFLDRVREEEAA